VTFLNPFGLIGLLSLPVIFALHLLFRRKQHYLVSHLGLWSFLDAETRGPQARRLPLTWILLLDLLIAALLSLAWARPALAVTPPDFAPRHWVIVLDNSTSMRAIHTDARTTRFEAAKTQAKDLLQQATTRDVITIVTFGGQARRIADNRQGVEAVSSAQLIEALEQAPVGETGTSLLEALALGQAAITSDLPAEFHILTDGSFPLPEADQQVVRRFPYPVVWHWFGGQARNQAVLDLNTTALSEARLQVFARLANYGSQAVTREIRLSVDGSLVNSAFVNLPPDSTLPYVWQVSLGGLGQEKSVSVSLTERGGARAIDGLAEDNHAVVGLQPTGRIRVALVADNPAPLQQAVQSVPGVDLRIITPVDYAAAQASESGADELTIFRGFVPDSWPAGNILLVDLPGQAGGAAGAAGLRAGPARDIAVGSLTQASATNPLVAGLDFSGVRWGQITSLAGTPAGFLPLLQAGGVPILLQGQVPQLVDADPPAGAVGQAVVLLADLTQGNFIQHPAFPILIANLVEQSRQAIIPPAFKTGAALPLPSVGSYQRIDISAPQSGEILPSAQGGLSQPEGRSPQSQTVNLQGSWPAQWSETHTPGLYAFRLTGLDGSQTEFISGAQAGDILESDLRPRGWTQIIAVTAADLRAGINTESLPFDLRGWLLGAAILLFFLQAVLAWQR
jgi:Ca-activated chloride channel homolog